MAVLLVVFRSSFTTGWIITVAVLWIISTAFWFGVSVYGLHAAKRDLASIPEGPAFYLDPHGIEFVFPKAAQVSWAEVTSFKLKGRNFGAGPAVMVETDGEEVGRVPISFLDAAPAIIDSAAQAYSLGRVRLDTDALDNVL